MQLTMHIYLTGTHEISSYRSVDGEIRPQPLPNSYPKIDGLRTGFVSETTAIPPDTGQKPTPHEPPATFRLLGGIDQRGRHPGVVASSQCPANHRGARHGDRGEKRTRFSSSRRSPSRPTRIVVTPRPTPSPDRALTARSRTCPSRCRSSPANSSRDIGATDLRKALSYSSSISLQTQNDLENKGGVGGVQGGAYGPGGVNNPEGVTSNISGVQLKIRGFITNNVLRNGFLRGSPSDAINIDRIEVVQGPNALLYGTGNFGGVVDYLTKRPLYRQQGRASLQYGMYDFKRASLDVTGPSARPPRAPAWPTA
jgi:hypothetical protein